MVKTTTQHYHNCEDNHTTLPLIVKINIQHYCHEYRSKIKPVSTLKHYVLVITHKHLQIQYLIHKKHSFSYTSINWLAHFWEITEVYCET